MERKKIIIISVVIAVVIIAIYFYNRKKKSKEKPVATDITSVEEPSEIKSVFPLSLGSRGKEVKQLQAYLIKNYGNVLKQYGADGTWGNEMTGAMKKNMGVTSMSEGMFKEKGIDKINV